MVAFRRLVALVLGTFLCGACAASADGSLSTRFVKPGKPTLDLGGPVPEAKRNAPPLPPARAASVGVSVENSDPRLSAALLLATAIPTAAHHLRVADEYRRLGILDASARHVDQAIKLEPRFAEAHERLARIWRDWGFPDQGLGAAYRAAFYAPRSPSAQNTLGTLLAAVGRPDDARRAYERALALEPNAAWVLNNLCDLERRRGRLSEARDRCEAALAIDASLGAAHNNLALTFAAFGDLDRARVEFLAGGDEASANYNLGLVHMADGDYRAAADAFEAAIRLRPAFTAAKSRAHTVRLYLLSGGK